MKMEVFINPSEEITIPTANIVPGSAYPQDARKIRDFWKLFDLYWEIIIKNIEASITKKAPVRAKVILKKEV